MRNWEQRAAWGGIAFVVLFLVGIGIAGDAASDDHAATAAYFADHRDTIILGNWLAGLGLMALLLWVWSLKCVLEEHLESKLSLFVLVTGALAVAVEMPVPTLGAGIAIA